MGGMRKWLLPGAAVTAVALMLAGGLERERRAEGGAEGALLKDRWRIRTTTAEVAEGVAEWNYRRELARYDEAGTLDSDPYLTELVGSVAEPLIVAAKDLYPQTRDWPWEWHLVETRQVNAYCSPGGRIVVLSGLLSEQVLGDDRDMLATVMAHEVSHAILQHTRESMGRGWMAQGLAWIMTKSLKIGALREAGMTRSLKLAFLDPKTRALETEADVLGLELMSRAGFPPAKAVETWERMGGTGRSGLEQRALAFLSDHPSDADRLARMKALQPKAHPLAAKGKTWEWTVQGVSDDQAKLLDAASGLFGLGTTFAVSEDSEVTHLLASAEDIAPAAAAEAVGAALVESGLSQGGVIQLGLSAMVRGVGGWQRLERIAAAGSKAGLRQSLTGDPAQVSRLGLSEEDRRYALSGAERMRSLLGSHRFNARLWNGLAAELSKTHPKGAKAILGWARRQSASTGHHIRRPA
jgi:hypothetical protein